MLLEKPDAARVPKTTIVEADEPLPATLTFVLGLGTVLVAVWLAMYLILRARW